MSSTFRFVELDVTSGAGNTRAITSIVGNVITISPNFGSVPAIGRTLEIINNTDDTLNNCLYTLIARAGATYTVRPTPVVTVGGYGSLRQRIVTKTIPISGSSIAAITALSGGLALVEVTGAAFITVDEVHPSDRLVATGAGVNNGAWYITDVLSNTLVVVTAPDGGAGMSIAGAGGTVAIRRGLFEANILTQASLSFTDLWTNATPAPGPGGSFVGPGSIKNWIQKSAVGGFNDSAIQTRTAFDLYGFGTINVNNAALGAPSTWTSQNEVVTNRNAVVAPASGVLSTTQCQITTSGGAWGAGKQLTLQIGNQPGSRLSADNGSCWTGVWADVTNNNVIQNIFGSYVDGISAIAAVRPVTGNVAVALIRGTFTPATGQTSGVACYGEFAFVGEGDGDNLGLLIASQINTSSILTSSVIGSLRISDSIDTPLCTQPIGGITVTLLDPIEDYDLSVIFGGVGASGTYEKRYVVYPNYVVLDNNISSHLIAVVGRRVVITEISLDDFSETEVYSGVTDANGLLTPGIPVLRTQRFVVGDVNTYYNHRFDADGGGYHPSSRTVHIQNQIIFTDVSVVDDIGIWTRRVP